MVKKSKDRCLKPKHCEWCNYFQNTSQPKTKAGKPGHTSLITRIPDEELCIILLNNTGHAKLELINYEILKILNGLDWTMKKNLAVELDKCHTAMDIEEVRKKFFENEDDYFDGENELCGLLYQRISKGEMQMADAIYNFALELYPDAEAIPRYRKAALIFRNSKK